MDSNDTTSQKKNIFITIDPLGIGKILSNNTESNQYISQYFYATNFGISYNTTFNLSIGIDVDIFHLNLIGNQLDYRTDVNNLKDLINIDKSYHTANLIGLNLYYNYIDKTENIFSVGVKGGYNFNGLEVFTDAFENFDSTQNTNFIISTIGKKKPSNQFGYYYSTFLNASFLANNLSLIKNLFNINNSSNTLYYLNVKCQYLKRSETFDMLLTETYDDGSIFNSTIRESIIVSSLDLSIGIGISF